MPAIEDMKRHIITTQAISTRLTVKQGNTSIITLTVTTIMVTIWVAFTAMSTIIMVNLTMAITTPEIAELLSVEPELAA